MSPPTVEYREILPPLELRSVVVCARAIRRLEEIHGMGSVDGVALELGITARHLERAFQSCVGAPPRSLSQVLRFRYALAQLEGGAALVDAAAQCLQLIPRPASPISPR